MMNQEIATHVIWTLPSGLWLILLIKPDGVNIDSDIAQTKNLPQHICTSNQDELHLVAYTKPL